MRHKSKRVVITCSHCQRPFNAVYIRQHSPTCTEQAEYKNLIIEQLHRLAHDGFICSKNEWDAYAKRNRLVHARILAERYGGWSGVAKWAGLTGGDWRAEPGSKHKHRHISMLNAPPEPLPPDEKQAAMAGVGLPVLPPRVVKAYMPLIKLWMPVVAYQLR